MIIFVKLKVEIEKVKTNFVMGKSETVTRRPLLRNEIRITRQIFKIQKSSDRPIENRIYHYDPCQQWRPFPLVIPPTRYKL